MTSFSKKIIWAVLFGLLTVVLLSFLADFKATVAALSQFKIVYLPLILLLTFANYLLRFVKWQFFLRQLDITVDRKDSFVIFLSGLAMSVTPGKVGELLKSVLLKELKGVPVSKTAPIIFAERLSDGFALLILSMAGMLLFSYGTQALIATGILMIIVVIILKTPRFYNPCLNFCSRLPVISKFAGVFENLMHSTGQLMKIKSLLFTVILGVVSWSFECIAFYFVFVGLGYKVPLIAATFVLAFSSIVGAVSMLPGGLGAAEASLLGLLVKVVAVPKGIAAVSTIIIRFCTLWFGVMVGIGALLTRRGLLSLVSKAESAAEQN